MRAKALQGNLSDAERRNMAAAIAMKFSEMIGGLESDDD